MTYPEITPNNHSLFYLAPARCASLSFGTKAEMLDAMHGAASYSFVPRHPRTTPSSPNNYW